MAQQCEHLDTLRDSLNSAAYGASFALRARTGGRVRVRLTRKEIGYKNRDWPEHATKRATVVDFTWLCTRHTFASG